MKQLLYLLLALYLGWLLAGCSFTRPLRDPKGKVLPRSIARQERIRLGGYDQYVLIRGADTVANPVLLWLHGGPGASATALNRTFNGELENQFTVVYWDQRGAGKSYSKKLSPETIRVGQYISDANELVQHLKKRFGKEKIVLVGHSWGSRLGMYLVDRYPEHFHSFVAIGLEVAAFEGESGSYAYTLEQAQRTQNQKALKELVEMGPPRNGNFHQMYKTGFWGLVRQKDWLLKLGGERYGKNHYRDWIVKLIRSDEYTFFDLIRWSKGSAFAAGTILNDPEANDFNFMKTIPAVRVPVWFVSGKQDYNTPWPLVQRYYEQIQAPAKQFILFEKSGHSPPFEEPERFNRFMLEEIRLLEGRNNTN